MLCNPSALLSSNCHFFFFTSVSRVTKIRLMKVCCGDSSKFNRQLWAAALSSQQGLQKTPAPRGQCTAPKSPGAAAQGTDPAAHTHPHSCPRGLAGSHPCSAAWTHSRRSPLCSDKQSSPCSCEFLSGTHRYLFSTQNTTLG